MLTQQYFVIPVLKWYSSEQTGKQQHIYTRSAVRQHEFVHLVLINIKKTQAPGISLQTFTI